MVVPITKSENYHVDLLENSSDTLVITFTEFGNKKLSGDGFGGAFLIKAGFDVLCIKSVRDSWYNDLPDDFFKIVNQTLSCLPYKYKKRIGYGSSMGAYAAITFAAPLKLDAVVAISPQYDISQPWDQRWKKYSGCGGIKTLKLADVAQGCQYFIIYDQYDKDLLHAQYYAEIIPKSQISEIRVPHSGHPSGFVLSDVRVIKEVVLRILSGNLDSGWFSSYRSERGSSGMYLFHLARHLFQKRKYRWAESIVSKALERDPRHHEFHMLRATVAERLGALDRALLHAATAVALRPNHPDMTATLARILAAMGYNPQAVYYIDRAIALAPESDRFSALRKSITDG